MSTGGAKLVVVNASSGPSGLYDSRKRRFMRFTQSCMVGNSRQGSQRSNRVITHFSLHREAKRKNFRWADLVQGPERARKRSLLSHNARRVTYDCQTSQGRGSGAV